MPASNRFPAIRLLLAVARGVVTALVLLDEIARPVYRPLAQWVASLRLVARMEAAVARLPRLAILLVLAVPFAVAEPLKIVGLVLIGRGQALAGLVILALAYLASFLLVERIYHAGRDKLLSYSWFAWAMGHLAAIRARALNWVRTSQAYAFATALRDEARRWWRGIRT